MQLKRRTGGSACWIQHPARCSNCRVPICQGFRKVLRSAVQRFDLRISASVVDARDAERWLSENGCVVFKFWATDFPMVSFLSGNYPAIR